jgi:hypothetical protein
MNVISNNLIELAGLSCIGRGGVDEGYGIEDDLYDVADVLANTIFESDTLEALSVGVHGKEGARKTRFLRNMQSIINGLPQDAGQTPAIAIWLDIEQCQGESQSVESAPINNAPQLRPTKKPPGDIRSEGEKALKAVLNELIILATGRYDPTPLLVAEQNAQRIGQGSSGYAGIRDEYADLAIRFDKVLDWLTGREERNGEICFERRAIIFIDNFRRCISEAAFELLKKTILLSRHQYCVFIVSLDENETESSETGYPSLGSLIQFNLRIPSLGKPERKNYLSSRLPLAMRSVDGLLDLLVAASDEADADTRTMNQLVTTLVFQDAILKRSFAGKEERYLLKATAVVAALRVLHPDEFNDICRHQYDCEEHLKAFFQVNDQYGHGYNLGFLGDKRLQALQELRAFAKEIGIGPRTKLSSYIKYLVEFKTDIDFQNGFYSGIIPEIASKWDRGGLHEGCAWIKDCCKDGIQDKDMLVTLGGFVWRVLERRGGIALLLSEFVIGHRPMDTNWRGQDEYRYRWKTSSLNAELNGEWLNKYLDDLIRVGVIIDPPRDTYESDDYLDKVFLLSDIEVGIYLNGSQTRIAKDTKNRETWWWLRSQGGISDSASSVLLDGQIVKRLHLVDSASGGVRPAMWITLLH